MKKCSINIIKIMAKFKKKIIDCFIRFHVIKTKKYLLIIKKTLNN